MSCCRTPRLESGPRAEKGAGGVPWRTQAPAAHHQAPAGFPQCLFTSRPWGFHSQLQLGFSTSKPDGLQTRGKLLLPVQSCVTLPRLPAQSCVTLPRCPKALSLLTALSSPRPLVLPTANGDEQRTERERQAAVQLAWTHLLGIPVLLRAWGQGES